MLLAATIYSLEDIKQFNDSGLDIFILGNKEYGNRLVSSFSEEEIKEATLLIHNLNKQIYINVNLIMHNEQIESVTNYLTFLKEINVDGIIYGDIGIYMLARNLEINQKMLYNPETLNTNNYDQTFWASKDILGIVISKELTIEDIIKISENKKILTGIVGHGYLNMFHSRRPLIKNFLTFNDVESKPFIDNHNLTLVEEIRDEKYPVIEDNQGTHIFRDKPMHSFSEFDKLKQVLDIFIIDGIFQDSEYLNNVIKDYYLCNNKDKSKLQDKLVKKYETTHDTGFLYKKTVYDKY